MGCDAISRLRYASVRVGAGWNVEDDPRLGEYSFNLRRIRPSYLS
jgi:hypothetical protein